MARALASPTNGPKPAGTWPHPLWLVLVLALAMSFWLGEGDSSTIAAPDAAARQERMLHFRDGPAGSILVIDAASGQRIEQLDGELGFVRGALRALVRERRRAGFDETQPFALREGADGRLWLADPPSGARLALDAFGVDNAARFAAWLPRPPGGPSVPRSPAGATP